MNKANLSLGLLGALVATLAITWVFNGQGVIHNDPKRNPQIFDNFSVLSFEKHAKFI